MYRLTKNFMNRINRGEIPVTYLVINTDKGNRIYSSKQLSGVFNQFNFIADGSIRGDGLVTGGNGISAIEISDRLINTGKLDRAIQPKTRDIINSLLNKQKQNINISLDNSDYKITSILSLEPFLTKRVWIYLGFESDNLSDHLILFSGEIYNIKCYFSYLELEISET